MFLAWLARMWGDYAIRNILISYNFHIIENVIKSSFKVFKVIICHIILFCYNHLIMFAVIPCWFSPAHRSTSPVSTASAIIAVPVWASVSLCRIRTSATPCPVPQAASTRSSRRFITSSCWHARSTIGTRDSPPRSMSYRQVEYSAPSQDAAWAFWWSPIVARWHARTAVDTCSAAIVCRATISGSVCPRGRAPVPQTPASTPWTQMWVGSYTAQSFPLV